MNSYIVKVTDTKKVLKSIRENINKYDIVNQMEVLAIIGRSLSATKLVSLLTNNNVTFTISGEDFYLIVIFANNKFTYDFKFGYKKVEVLTDEQINLSQYLIGAKFILQIGNKEYKTNYDSGTISDEIAILLKKHFPLNFNVVSLGVLINHPNDNEVVESAGYIMLFKNSINIESLVSVFARIPMVTKLLMSYESESEIFDYLTNRIDEEIINGNLKYN